ncbi:hypothetical protein [uncultured Desulfuromonas sp.]|uniref:hypothetical protein n=1 Tax=uncultured Desulfuromonas sp. TaxID=181013 RepID=UPI002AAB013D|nr:hypothetical protein [uncultured Desulfuromonas sp.]
MTQTENAISVLLTKSRAWKPALDFARPPMGSTGCFFNHLQKKAASEEAAFSLMTKSIQGLCHGRFAKTRFCFTYKNKELNLSLFLARPSLGSGSLFVNSLKAASEEAAFFCVIVPRFHK